MPEKRPKTPDRRESRLPGGSSTLPESLASSYKCQFKLLPCRIWSRVVRLNALVLAAMGLHKADDRREVDSMNSRARQMSIVPAERSPECQELKGLMDGGPLTPRGLCRAVRRPSLEMPIRLQSNTGGEGGSYSSSNVVFTELLGKLSLTHASNALLRMPLGVVASGKGVDWLTFLPILVSETRCERFEFIQRRNLSLLLRDLLLSKTRRRAVWS